MGRRPNNLDGKIQLFYRNEPNLSGYYASNSTSPWKTVYRHTGNGWFMSAWALEGMQENSYFELRSASECPDAGELEVTIGLATGTIGF